MIEKFIIALAYRLPRRLAYWCYIRVASSATVYQFPDRTPHEVTIMDALEAWKS